MHGRRRTPHDGLAEIDTGEATNEATDQGGGRSVGGGVGAGRGAGVAAAATSGGGILKALCEAGGGYWYPGK
jgi:hypothetical protein